MNMRWTERGPVVALVLLAHVALLWAWRFAAMPVPRERTATEPRNVTVLRLIESRPQEPDVQPTHAPAVPRSPASLVRPSTPKPDVPAPAAPQTITLPPHIGRIRDSARTRPGAATRRARRGTADDERPDTQ